jgi:hypothetical protein
MIKSDSGSNSNLVHHLTYDRPSLLFYPAHWDASFMEPGRQADLVGSPDQAPTRSSTRCNASPKPTNAATSTEAGLALIAVFGKIAKEAVI